MAVSVSGALNSNLHRDNGIGTALTDEKQITLIVSNKDGTNRNHHVGLEISGGTEVDGDFVDVPESLVVGVGARTIHYNAGYVKAKVFKPEGGTSEVNITIIAR